MHRLRVQRAAELGALAELARGAYLRGEGGDLHEVIRAERKAEQATRALGISEAKPKGPSLSEYLASRQAAE